MPNRIVEMRKRIAEARKQAGEPVPKAKKCCNSRMPGAHTKYCAKWLKRNDRAS